MMVGGLVAILGMLSFNFLQGYFQPQLMHGLTIILFLLVMRLSQLTGQQKTGTALLFAGVALQLALTFTSNPITLS
jgi:ABC-type Fe3+-siderophore transport system permease subunit